MDSFETKPRGQMAINIYGTDYMINKPSVGQIRKVQQASKTKDESGLTHLDIMNRFMIDLGLPEDVLNDMELEDWGDLVDFVTGTKKK